MRSSPAPRGIRTPLLGLAFAATAAGAGAQEPNALAADRARIAEITGQAVATARDPLLTDLFPALRAGGWLLERGNLFLVRPVLVATHNSDIPYSLNDGPMWAGRGWNAMVGGGLGSQVRWRGAELRVVVAPTLVFSQNLPFPFLPNDNAARSVFASPWHNPGEPSLDIPVRFGDRYLLRLDPGRSEVRASAYGVAAGITARNEVWGPGIRNQLVMSAHAPGIPRLYVGTARPVRLRIGLVEAKLFGGTLTESMFFDREPGNQYRAVSGILAQLRPAFDTMLTVGLARGVYSPTRAQVLGGLGRIFDALIRWEGVHPVGDTTAGGQPSQRADAITSLFARWVFPAAAFEVYGERAWMELPYTFSDLLLASHHSSGYTLGFQFAPPVRDDDRLRLQAEVTYLEQSRVFANRPLVDFYAGQVSPQGYTQRGQVIGAAIGPGGSSQFIGLDWLAPRWQGGVFVGRIRWENDALYRQGAANFFRHDVTVLMGTRGGVRTPLSDFVLEATYGYRYNYQFQYGGANPGGFRTVDARNLTVTLAATPR